MKQIVLGVLLLAMASTTMACNKPSEDSCRKALLNMQQLMNTENLNEAGFTGEVRRCKGGSSRTAVDCAIKATTLEQLRKCDFYKVPGKPAPAPGSGSGSGLGAAPPTGPVTGLDTGATGSAGSAAGGSAASATGSAPIGSADATPGSAASAAGSAGSAK